MGARAIHRPLRANSRFRPFAPANLASRRGLAAAVAALNGQGEPIVGEAAIAAMHERRVQTDQAAARQPSLALRVSS